MIMDKYNLFSDDQAVTTTAASTNVIDLGADLNIPGADTNQVLELFAQVSEEDFAGGTSVKLQVQTDTTDAFSSATTVAETAAIALADLVKGYRFAMRQLPDVAERYVRLNYVVVGTHTAGKITAGLKAVAA